MSCVVLASGPQAREAKHLKKKIRQVRPERCDFSKLLPYHSSGRLTVLSNGHRDACKFCTGNCSNGTSIRNAPKGTSRICSQSDMWLLGRERALFEPIVTCRSGNSGREEPESALDNCISREAVVFCCEMTKQVTLCWSESSNVLRISNNLGAATGKGMYIVGDPVSLKKVGLKSIDDLKVKDLDLRGIPLRDALRTILDQVKKAKLDYEIRDDKIFITAEKR